MFRQPPTAVRSAAGPDTFRLRVLIVQLSAGFAGTERHAAELANGLAPHADVAVLLRARPREAHRQAEYRALRAAVAPGIPVFLSSRGAPCFGLWRALWRFRPDLIHAHHERSARVATLCARLAPGRLGWLGRGVPVVATVHVHYRARDFGRCRALVVLNEAEQVRVRAVFPREVSLIENWVVPRRWPDAARLAALRREFGIAAGDFVVGCVGRLAPVKRVGGLIAAFAQAGLKQSRLLVVGDGDERPALEAEIARLGLGNRVRLAGFRADVRDFYALFDLLVLNSADEPYGLVILEAAAGGVPVIATATDGARAIAARLPITLVPIDRPDALAQAMRAAQAARHAAAPPLAGFSFEDRLPALLALYRRVRDGGISRA